MQTTSQQQQPRDAVDTSAQTTQSKTTLSNAAGTTAEQPISTQEKRKSGLSAALALFPAVNHSSAGLSSSAPRTTTPISIDIPSSQSKESFGIMNSSAQGSPVSSQSTPLGVSAPQTIVATSPVQQPEPQYTAASVSTPAPQQQQSTLTLS